MSRLLLPLLLTLATAAACPVKSGYFANGEFKDTTGLLPQCTPAFKKLTTQVKPTEYAEIYRTTLDAAGGQRVARAVSLMTSHGWKRVTMPANGKTTQYGFSKGGKQTVISVREASTFVLLLVVGDK